MSLARWGWNSYFEAIWHGEEGESTAPARVIAQQRKFLRVVGEFGERWAEPSGKLRLTAGDGGDWPAVRDWVTVELHDAGSSCLICRVLQRRSQFVRKTPGRRIAKQVLAANVDVALLVCALDGDFNPRRVERYLAECWGSGAKPIVVLNKADTCEDVRIPMTEAERIAMAVPVSVVSAKTGQGFEDLEKFLAAGQTFVLLGSSGAGKSTIANRLLGQAKQKVQEVRESDSRGRHTTTARQLFMLLNGALLIDTPGLRELQLWDADEGIAKAFADIDAYALNCRFNDCRHQGEPDCAVQAALNAGDLDSARLENRRKLQREQDFLRRKIDPEAREIERRRIKKVMRDVRRMYRTEKTN